MTKEELKDPEDYYRKGVLDATREFSYEEITILPVTEGFNSGVLRTFLSNRRKSLLETPETVLDSKWLSTLWGFKDGDPDERGHKETPTTSDYRRGVEDATKPIERYILGSVLYSATERVNKELENRRSSLLEGFNKEK